MRVVKYSYYLKSIFNLLTKFENPGLILRMFLGKPRDQLAEIGLRGGDLRFYVRGTMDIWSIKETFIDRFYERFGTPIQDGWTIIDIGAGLGDYVIFATHNYPSNRVFAYEPFHQSYTMLQKNLQLNRVVGVKTFKQAVSGQTGVILLDLSGGEPLQITSAEIESDVEAQADRLIVDSLSLADVLEFNNITTCDLLKLDCEGAEYEIIFFAGEAVLDRINRIVMEYHDGVTKHDHKEMVEYLQSHGYRVSISPNYVHADLGYLYAYRESFHP